jgi:uncharacterized protein YodC (DUF2158 family)
MTVFKSGDLVMLKSGGPTMTVDTVNTSIFDDDKITGILCVWFVGEKLQRVRFEPGAIEPAPLQKVRRTEEVPSPEAAGDYKTVLDEMVDAMNLPAEAAHPASAAACKKPKSARASKSGIDPASTVSTPPADRPSDS